MNDSAHDGNSAKLGSELHPAEELAALRATIQLKGLAPSEPDLCLETASEFVARMKSRKHT